MNLALKNDKLGIKNDEVCIELTTRPPVPAQFVIQTGISNDRLFVFVSYLGTRTGLGGSNKFEVAQVSFPLEMMNSVLKI